MLAAACPPCATDDAPLRHVPPVLPLEREVVASHTQLRGFRRMRKRIAKGREAFPLPTGSMTRSQPVFTRPETGMDTGFAMSRKGFVRCPRPWATLSTAMCNVVHGHVQRCPRPWATHKPRGYYRHARARSAYPIHRQPYGLCLARRSVCSHAARMLERKRTGDGGRGEGDLRI